jgi:hypothetical protein
MTEPPRPSEPTGLTNPPPVLTAAQHMLNVCTIASGMVVAHQYGSLGDDAIAAYDLVLKAYQNTGLPIS